MYLLSGFKNQSEIFLPTPYVLNGGVGGGGEGAEQEGGYGAKKVKETVKTGTKSNVQARNAIWCKRQLQTCYKL